MSIQYHAVMLDETRCEFGADVTADSRAEAYEILGEMYPESQCVQLESPADTASREARMYDDIRRGVDYDEDGRPFFTGEGDVDYDEPDEEPDEEDVDDSEERFTSHPDEPFSREDDWLDSSYEES